MAAVDWIYLEGRDVLENRRYDDQVLGILGHEYLGPADHVSAWDAFRGIVLSPDAHQVITAGQSVERADGWLRQLNSPAGKPQQNDDPGRPHRPDDAGGTPRHDALGLRELGNSQPLPVCQYITAIAHLRAGDYPMAIQLLEVAGSDEHWPCYEIVYAPVATAH